MTDIYGIQSINWDEHVKRQVLLWKKHSQHWLNVKYPIYRIRYEDLKTDPANHLTLVISWFGSELPSEQIEAAVRESQLKQLRKQNPEFGSKFFRRGQSNRGLERFTDEQKHFVINTLQDLMIACGYEDIIANIAP